MGCLQRGECQKFLSWSVILSIWFWPYTNLLSSHTHNLRCIIAAVTPWILCPVYIENIKKTLVLSVFSSLILLYKEFFFVFFLFPKKFLRYVYKKLALSWYMYARLEIRSRIFYSLAITILYCLCCCPLCSLNSTTYYFCFCPIVHVDSRPVKHDIN